MGYTFKKLTVEILENAEKPLTATEIWDRATEKGLVDKLESSGKTPMKTLEAIMYTDCNSTVCCRDYIDKLVIKVNRELYRIYEGIYFI